MEGAKHLFTLCDKRHFTPVRNRLLLLWTVWLHHYNTFFSPSISYLTKLAREREEATYHAPHANVVTMAPSPLVRNNVKTWQGHGMHWQKNISIIQLGLLRVDLTKWTIKKHIYLHKKHTFCQHVLWSAACGTSSYKIKNELFSLYKIASLYCGDCASPCDVGWSHSPIILKLLEAGGRGGSWCRFFYVCCLCCLLRCAWSDSWLKILRVLIGF